MSFEQADNPYILREILLDCIANIDLLTVVSKNNHVYNIRSLALIMSATAAHKNDGVYHRKVIVTKKKVAAKFLFIIEKEPIKT